MALPVAKNTAKRESVQSIGSKQVTPGLKGRSPQGKTFCEPGWPCRKRRQDIHFSFSGSQIRFVLFANGLRDRPFATSDRETSTSRGSRQRLEIIGEKCSGYRS